MAHLDVEENRPEQVADMVVAHYRDAPALTNPLH